MNRFNAANRPGFHPLSPQEQERQNVLAKNRRGFNQLQQNQENVNGNRIQTMTREQLQEDTRRFYRHTIFERARGAQMQPAERKRLEDTLNSNEVRGQSPFNMGSTTTNYYQKIVGILDKLCAAPPTEPTDDQPRISNPPQHSYFVRINEFGPITSALRSNNNQGLGLNGSAIAGDINDLRDIFAQCTNDTQKAFVNDLIEHLQKYALHLDPVQAERSLRPPAQFDQAIMKFGKITLFLAAAAGAIINGAISLRNKSEPTAALIYGGIAFALANPNLFTSREMKNIRLANRVIYTSHFPIIANQHNIEGDEWHRICGSVISDSEVETFVKKVNGGTATPQIKRAFFNRIARYDRPGDEIDEAQLTPIQDALRLMIMGDNARQFVQLYDSLAPLRNNQEARDLALSSIRSGAWRLQTPQQQPPPTPRPQPPPVIPPPPRPRDVA